jgi:hypothetical protein
MKNLNNKTNSKSEINGEVRKGESKNKFRTFNGPLVLVHTNTSPKHSAGSTSLFLLRVYSNSTIYPDSSKGVAH